MEKNYFNKKHFYQLIIANKYIDSFQYLLKTNNLNLILQYQKKYKRFQKQEDYYRKIYKEASINKLISKVHIYYYHKLLCNDNLLLSAELEAIKKEIIAISNIYYLINNDNIILWKEIKELSIDCRLLECFYHFKFFVISGFLFKGFINYFSLNKISLDYFIFNDKLYINKSYYKKNIKSKKLKLLLISQAQYFYDLNSKKYTFEEIIIRKKKIVEIYKNNS